MFTKPAIAEVPNLLRPEQIASTKDEITRLEGAIAHPLAQDKALMAKQIRALKHSLEEFSPKPYAPGEIDSAVAEEARLREEMIADGMPTHAEMRRNVTGAGPLSGSVHKHMGWEARNKAKLLRWKYLRQRIHAGANDPNVANFENYRPTSASHEGDLSTAQIPGKQIHLPPPGADMPATFSDRDLKVLGELDSTLRDAVGTMNNTQRAEVLAFVRRITEENLSPRTLQKPKRKRNLSAEQRAAIATRLKAGREAAKAAAAAQAIPTTYAEPQPAPVLPAAEELS